MDERALLLSFVLIILGLVFQTIGGHPLIQLLGWVFLLVGILGVIISVVGVGT